MGRSPAPAQPGKKALAGAWSFLKHPTSRDVRGARRTRKALDAPPVSFDHLVVMDFEWTADDRSPPPPLEIIEFPCVLLDMRRSAWPGRELGRFQQYVTPQRSRLTPFITELTAITQRMVDPPNGTTFPVALERFGEFLRSHGIEIDQPGGGASSRVAVVTWGDVDCATALRLSCEQWRVPIPKLFSSWVDLKQCYRRHYKRDPIGLRRTVEEHLGLTFEGRAHSGLVDSFNTAKIVLRMAKDGFVFSQGTRGFGPDGLVWGSRNSKKRAVDGGAGTAQKSGLAGARAGQRHQAHTRAEVDSAAAAEQPGEPPRPHELSPADREALEQMAAELHDEEAQRACAGGQP